MKKATESPNEYEVERRLGLYHELLSEVYIYLAYTGWALQDPAPITPASQWRDISSDVVHTTRNALMIQLNRDWLLDSEQEPEREEG